MDNERVAAVQEILLRRLKEARVGQLNDAGALRSLSVEIARTLCSRKRKRQSATHGTAANIGLVPTFSEAATNYIDLHPEEARREIQRAHEPDLLSLIINTMVESRRGAFAVA